MQPRRRLRSLKLFRFARDQVNGKSRLLRMLPNVQKESSPASAFRG